MIESLENVENSKFAINININHYMTKNPKQADATFHIANLVKYYNIKDNDTFCWKYTVGNTNFFKYSQQALDFLAEEMRKDPEHLLDNIKNKSTPEAKEF